MLPSSIRPRALAARLAALLVLTAAAPLAAQSSPRGRWTVEHTAGRERVQLSLRNLEESEHDRSMTSFGVKAADLAGLSVATLDGGGDSVSFRFVRDAGTITFTGRVGRGLGVGLYTFVPNEAFLADLARRGYGAASEHDALRLTLGGITNAYVARLDALHYARPTMSELVRLSTHGVTLDYLNEMAALGFTTGTASELTRLFDHGVTPEFVKELAAAGYAHLDAPELVRARDHGVDAAFAREWTRAGYANLPLQTLVRFRDHGVDPAFAKAFQRDGTAPSPEELVRARDRGERGAR